MVLKLKRKTGRNSDARYLRVLRELRAKPNVYEVDPSISAQRLMAACRAVVCMPFSAPAVIAHYQNRPTAYYDPTGQLLFADRESRGIPVLRGRRELRDWLAKLNGTEVVG